MSLSTYISFLDFIFRGNPQQLVSFKYMNIIEGEGGINTAASHTSSQLLHSHNTNSRGGIHKSNFDGSLRLLAAGN
jgi:hypothetical protein